MTSSPVGVRAGRARPGSRRKSALLVVGVAIAAAVYVHAWTDTEASFSALFSGFGNMADIIRRSYPPSTHVFHDSVTESIVTLDTALLGTTAALVFSLLLTPFAAKNIAPNRVVYEAARIVIAVTRAVPDLIFALLFVTAVGLGPFAGVLALAVHSIGTLGKLFAETVEDMDMGPVNALRVSGAGRIQVFVHGVLPGVAPTFVSLLLYRLDVNVRSGLTLGAVGAGGIGFLIYNSIQLFQYRQLSMELGVMLAMVLAVERISTLARSRIV